MLAAFLVSVADELALAIVARSQCENKYDQGTNEIVEIVADKDTHIDNKGKHRSYRKVKKKVKKRVKYKN